MLRTGDYIFLVVVAALGLAIAYLRQEVDEGDQKLDSVIKQRAFLQHEISKVNGQRRIGGEVK